MKTTLIATLVLIIPFLGFSQINQSIDVIGGMDYSYRSLSASGEDATSMGIIEIRDNIEIGNVSWRVGFNYNLRLTNKVFLKTGLRFASVGYKEKKRTGLRWGSEYDGEGGWIPDPSLPHEIQLVDDYWFTEIPIVARYEINQKKLSPFFELGISPTIFLAARLRRKNDIGSDTEFLNTEVHRFNRFHLVGFISFGLNYSLNDNYQLFGQPAFRYHFTDLVDNPIGERLYNFGIEVGVRRVLR